MTEIRLDTLTKRYGTSTAVDGIDLTIGEGEFFSLLGPSGCGKSTTLRMIAGFVTPSAGRILLGDDDVTALPPEARDIGIVFQNYAIFPHMNVAANIAFGLKMRKVGKAEIDKRVREVLAQVGLEGYENRYSRELSGGEQQRVALARVLVTRPRILLLDEPLSALDKNMREEMKFWIKDLQKSLGITTVYVTHDQDEALTMSDRIGVMERSRLVQVGTPEEIYERPATLFVTGFIGHSNLIDVTARPETEGHCRVHFAGADFSARVRGALDKETPAQLAVRPENVIVDAETLPDGVVAFPAKVVSETYQGPIVRYRIDIQGTTITAERQNQAHRPRLAVGDAVLAGWDPARCETLLR
ncbi:ABC transporter ATP-binding protein [Jiella sp. MQZ9-1]|uniref:Spermidine/putrescine import ATP-binding protein PotA n=1 Tax=Jiella flava TaxID=2816857 RepID=A0A939FYN6_9HYPH|nr:ABC transporter ATP-binding protein [Jiella flava]MBO0662428.1 ABC transporter ATP-binding protein [Jiella flava]MCD2471652.1 ABC transporter ATP-binding protein [Jiella flava]